MTIKMLSLIYRSKIRTSLAAPSHLPSSLSLFFSVSVSLFLSLLTILCLCFCSHLSLSVCSPQSVGGPSTNPRTHPMHCAALRLPHWKHCWQSVLQNVAGAASCTKQTYIHICDNTATTIKHYCKIIVANVACTFMARVHAVAAALWFVAVWF